MPVVVLFEKLLAQVERSTKSHEVEQFWVIRGSFLFQERKHGHHGNLLVYGPGRYKVCRLCENRHTTHSDLRPACRATGAVDLARVIEM